MYCIYVIENQDNGKRYVGKTERIKFRVYEHMLLLRRGKHRNKDMQEDFNKRKKNFVWYVVQSDIKAGNGCREEIQWMQKLKTFLPEYGYNSKDAYFWRNGKRTCLAKGN